MFVCCGGNSIDDDDDDDCFLVGAAFVSLFTATKHEKKMMKNVYEKKNTTKEKEEGRESDRLLRATHYKSVRNNTIVSSSIHLVLFLAFFRRAARVFRRPWYLGDGPCARVWERQNLFYSSDNCLLFYRDGDCSSHPTRSESGA